VDGRHYWWLHGFFLYFSPRRKIWGDHLPGREFYHNILFCLLLLTRLRWACWIEFKRHNKMLPHSKLPILWICLHMNLQLRVSFCTTNRPLALNFTNWWSFFFDKIFRYLPGLHLRKLWARMTFLSIMFSSEKWIERRQDVSHSFYLFCAFLSRPTFLQVVPERTWDTFDKAEVLVIVIVKKLRKVISSNCRFLTPILSKTD